MKNIHSIEFYTESKEELLPGFEKDFPYIASRAELDKYMGCYVPWHWHRTVELFYMESGSIEYDTPGGKIVFPAGSGGMINPNVLHMTKARSQREKKVEHNKSNDKIKLMMIYIHEHYREKISIPELAAAAYLSERECYREFRDCLNMTPVEYITAYRLQAACQMLTKGQEAVTVISHECGLGSSSYFGKVFREYAHCSPIEYRKKWQNSDR